MTSQMTLRQAEPGSRLPAPDAELRLLQGFVNTIDIEGEEDELRTPAKASAWLAAAGLTPAATRVTAADHARLLALREGFRALSAANNGEPLADDERVAFNGAVASVQIVGSVEADGRWSLRSSGGAIDQALARLLGTLDRSMADGTWSRMKACRNHGCRWLFWDASRNRSGTWCTMTICGSRQKARDYRARRRSA